MTTDSLRERIREILWRELEYDGEDFCGHVADVLIRELRLLRAKQAAAFHSRGSNSIYIKGDDE